MIDPRDAAFFTPAIDAILLGAWFGLIAGLAVSIILNALMR